MTFPRVVRESGLSKSELAVLYSTARQTIYYWLKHPPGAKKPGDRGVAIYPPEKFAAITQALEKLIDMHQLPWATLNEAARRERVTRMSAKLQGLKPAPTK